MKTHDNTKGWIIRVAALCLAGLGAALGKPCAAGPSPATPAQRPNIVIILSDDQGYQDAGFMGSKEIVTPNLDQLARGGTILKSFYVQPVCSPSRAALMSGRYPLHTGVYTWNRPHDTEGLLPLEERTLAEALRDAGYETAICGKWHLGEFKPAYLPTRRGFDHQYGLWFGGTDYFTHRNAGVVDWHRDDQPCGDEGYTTHLIAREACRIIKEKQADKPLFLYVPFNAVHSPYEMPTEYETSFANLKDKRRIYAGMTAAMDDAIGQIMAALKDRGLLDNTLVIFSSDNGGVQPLIITSNAPLRDGKATVYEGGVRVCACVSWPGHIPSGKVIDEPLHIVDWYPTLVKLAGGTMDQKLPVDGLDIWPVLTQGAKSPHDSIPLSGVSRQAGYSKWPKSHNALLSGSGVMPPEVAIRMGDWKLVYRRDRYELYNLTSDIGEQHDLAAQQPDKVKELRIRLEQWLSKAVPFPLVEGDSVDVKDK